MEPQIPLTYKEQKAINQQKKLESKETTIQNRQTWKIIKIALWGTLCVAIIGGFIWLISSQPKTPDSEIVSRSGLHWHPELSIYVKGEKLEIPENIGLNAVHKPIHTHDDIDQGIVHMEFQGLTRKQDTILGQFFKNWGKDMRSFGANMKMTVNGKENKEYENYLMKDKDKIELRYE